MSSSPAPATATTPERPPPASSNPAIRRSATLPARTATRSQPQLRGHAHSPSTNDADGIETLFISASTKIVSFTATLPNRPSNLRRDGVQIETKPIPWGTVTERTLAVGVLRIYRVTSSNVSFLNSGNLLHTIFPRSQCWCVDAEGKFVLKVRMDSFYRIELPYETEEDKQKAVEFKAVLSQVLQFERTPCPFSREFEVELPDRPKTPPRRRSSFLKKAPERAKKWLFDKQWVPEDGPMPSTSNMERPDSNNNAYVEDDDDDNSSVITEPIASIPATPKTTFDTTPPKSAPPKPYRTPSVRERAMTFQGLRNLNTRSGLADFYSTPTMQLIPQNAPASDDHLNQLRGNRAHSRWTTGFGSFMSSQESFYYSLQNSAQASPSPPYLDAKSEQHNPWAEEYGPSTAQLDQRGRGRHRRKVSEITVRAQSSEPALPSSPCTPIMNVHPGLSATAHAHLSSPPSTPPLINDSDEDSLSPPLLDAPTPPDAIRMRKLTGATQRRAFSPMPHPQNLIFRRNTPGPAKQLTEALVRKTIELLFGPPAHLVTLMLRIAHKISNFGFNTYSLRGDNRKYPGSWESSDESEWVEDDFGIPLDNLDGSSVRRTGYMGELD